MFHHSTFVRRATQETRRTSYYVEIFPGTLVLGRHAERGYPGTRSSIGHYAAVNMASGLPKLAGTRWSRAP